MKHEVMSLKNIIEAFNIDKIGKILEEKQITEDNINSYLKYAYKNINELLQNEK